MATSEEYIKFVCDNIPYQGPVRYRKMFGEYMVYVDDRPVLLVCDDTVFVKKLDAAAELMAGAPCGFPYDGAKEHYILDIENRELAAALIPVLVSAIPIPKKKQIK